MVASGGTCESAQRPCAAADDSPAGGRDTDCLPGDADPNGNANDDEPRPEHEIIRRWEFAGRKQRVEKRKYLNPNPFYLSEALFHGWEGGTGIYDCEPLYRTFNYNSESWGAFASFALNDGWALK